MQHKEIKYRKLCQYFCKNYDHSHTIKSRILFAESLYRNDKNVNFWRPIRLYVPCNQQNVKATIKFALLFIKSNYNVCCCLYIISLKIFELKVRREIKQRLMSTQ